jgi:protein-S-isoprenylcysteine O-methyltransferase Ste14
MIKRTLFLAYGVVSYLFFFGTFLYAIAFVGGFVVPTSLDGRPVGPFGQSLLFDLGLLTLFAVQHSVMARRWFKEWWTRIVPVELERSTYVLFASAALALLCWQWRPLGGQVWRIGQPVATVFYVLFAIGYVQVLVVTFLINHFDLFGLRQVWLYFTGKPYTKVKFVTPAPYRFVRHPLYLGFMIAFWATPNMTVAHLVFAVATTAYILVAIQFEERDLKHEHGAAYDEYRQQVPMILPIPRAAGERRAASSEPA